MAVKQMKTNDAAALRRTRVRVNPKGASLDAVPGRQITPFLEKVEILHCLSASWKYCRYD
jgi:hypothetical protein